MSAFTLEHPSSVLLIEPDELLAYNVSMDLKESGYDPLVVADSQRGLVQIMERQPALIIIDRMLGADSGLVLCHHLRQLGNQVPVLLLISRDNVEDRVACLEAGADDYFVKPYRSEEFLQLVQLYLQPETVSSEQLKFGDLVLDLSTRRAYRHDRMIDLTAKEYELLRFFMEHPREVLSRDQILENVWGYDFLGESNVIEVYIRYLRLKIEQDGERRLIQTVRGVGYVLRDL